MYIENGREKYYINIVCARKTIPPKKMFYVLDGGFRRVLETLNANSRIDYTQQKR